MRQKITQSVKKVGSKTDVFEITCEGAIQNYVQAHKWFNIARANGYEGGRKNRGIDEKLMTSDQIAEAERLAKERISFPFNT